MNVSDTRHSCYLVLMPLSFNKYRLYENSVQNTDEHVPWMVTVYKELNGQSPKQLREDFCGTFKTCCEWIQLDRSHTAVGLDLDPEPLEYGRLNHLPKLSSSQKKRLRILEANVLTTVTPKTDIIFAGNFSFFIFKEKKDLLQYFRTSLKSLAPQGIVVLEMAGGPGMITVCRETRKVDLTSKTKFTYIWDQKSFDPIQNNGKYAIHFKLPNGKTLKDSFVYDWRLWSIPETRDALIEAGFEDTFVYWETEHRGRGTGEYVQAQVGDNSHSWIAYVVGRRSRARS